MADTYNYDNDTYQIIGKGRLSTKRAGPKCDNCGLSQHQGDCKFCDTCSDRFNRPVPGHTTETCKVCPGGPDRRCTKWGEKGPCTPCKNCGKHNHPSEKCNKLKNCERCGKDGHAVLTCRQCPDCGHYRKSGTHKNPQHHKDHPCVGRIFCTFCTNKTDHEVLGHTTQNCPAIASLVCDMCGENGHTANSKRCSVSQYIYHRHKDQPYKHR